MIQMEKCVLCINMVTFFDQLTDSDFNLRMFRRSKGIGIEGKTCHMDNETKKQNMARKR